MAGEVWYHGRGNGAGPRPVVTEDADGNMTGVLHHVVKHSPTGLSWGYSGSGPADTARSVLIAALGDAARCPACKGTGKVVWTADDECEDPVPYDPAVHSGTGSGIEFVVDSCYDCDDGWRVLPYQDFKREFVAGWGEEWRMSREDILAWLRDRGVG